MAPSMTINDLWSKIQLENKDIRADMKCLISELKDVKAGHEKWAKNLAALKKSSEVTKIDVVHLQAKVAMLEQAPLNCNLIVRGVPEKDEENLRNVMKSIFRAVNETAEYKITSVYRLGVKIANKTRPILLKLSSADQKYKLLRDKKNIMIDCSQIMDNGTAIGTLQDVIFFAEQLGPINSRLFYIMRKLVKEKQLYRTWIYHGMIYVCKTKGDDGILVRHESDLVSILGTEDDDIEVSESAAAEVMVNASKYAPKQSSVMEEPSLLSLPSTSMNRSMQVLQKCIQEASITPMASTKGRLPRAAKGKGAARS